MIGGFDIMEPNLRRIKMKVTKKFVFAAAIVSCAVVEAKHNHEPHRPHGSRICRECDGRGKVRSWKNVWIKWRECRDCNGRGYFMVKPAPVKHVPKHQPKVEKPMPPKHHPARNDHDRRQDNGPKGKRR